MAKDPRRKKDTPQTHAKKQAAAKKRHRWTKGTPHAGEFQRSPLAAIFHQSVARQVRPLRRMGAMSPFEEDKQPRLPTSYNAEGEPSTNWNDTLAKPKNVGQGEVKKPKSGSRHKRSAPKGASKARQKRQRQIERANSDSVLAPAYKPENVIEAMDKERRSGSRGKQSGAVNMSDDPGKPVPGFAEGPGIDAKRSRETAEGIQSTKDERDLRYNPRVMTGDQYPLDDDDWVRSQIADFDSHYRQLIQAGTADDEARRIAGRTAADLTMRQFGRATDPRVLEEIIMPREPQRTENRDDMRERVESDELWRTHRGTFTGTKTPDEHIPLEMVRGKKRPQAEEIFGRLPQSEQDFLNNEFQDPNSAFFGAADGARDAQRNLEDYLALRHDNFATNEIMLWMQDGKPESVHFPGRSKPTNADSSAGDPYADMQRRRFGDVGAPKDKYDAQGKHSTFSYSMQAAGVDTFEDLRKRFPNMSESGILAYQEQQRETVNQYMLEANERWAHETRSARIRGKSDANIEDEDRVVFFTTNLGAPTASVPANSLLGQYIIKKRKKMVVDDKLSTRQQVKGEFPKAVRDQHLFEVSTGISLGVQGRAGLFHNTGWKKGTKRSKGYGKKAPVGATVLRDSSGQPIYDKDGNVRYTEGYTRPFSVGTDRDVGLRIFIG